MNVPLKVVFRGMDPSPALEHDIRDRVAKLVRVHQKVTSCHVAVEAPGHKGAVFEVRIDLIVPGGQIVVAREPGRNQAHEDPRVALRDAFGAAGRQLEHFRQRRRRAVKRHEMPDTATVVSLTREAPGAGYGFIETPDDLQVYFHENAVPAGAFDALAVGDEVRFVLAPDEAEEGPHASTVEAVSEARYPMSRALDG